MPPVKITIYTNKDGLVGGYFARTTRPSVTDAPSFLFDAKGENVIRDSFFSTPQEREAFKASMETMLKKFTIQKDILCSN